MKLRQIEFAISVARTGSFSRAAAQCNASQPTLSSAVSLLEQELGGTLFSRTTRKVELNAFGQHMMPHLEAVLTARDEASAAARSFLHPEQAMIRIGLSPLVDMWLVNRVTEPYQRQHPDTAVFFKECLLDDLSERLNTGAIDAAILPADSVPPMLERAEFYAEPLRYLPCNGQIDQAAGAIQVANLPQDPIIMTGGGCGLNQMLDVLFAQEGLAVPRYPGQAISYPVIQEWAWLGFGAAVLPQGKLTDSAQLSLPLLRRTGAPAEVTFRWVWRRESRERLHIAEFLDYVRGKGRHLIAGRAGLSSV